MYGRATTWTHGRERDDMILDTDRWDGTLFSGGWRNASSTLEVTEPATGANPGQVGLASADDVARAAELAQAASQPGIR